MAFLSGERITATRINRLQPKVYSAACSAALTATTSTYADITGASVTLTTDTDNAVYMATAVFDMNVLATSTTILMVGRMQIDGVTDSGIAVYAMDALTRATVTMQWHGTISSAGSHTFKLQGALTNALATGGAFQQDDTKLIVSIYEVV